MRHNQWNGFSVAQVSSNNKLLSVTLTASAANTAFMGGKCWPTPSTGRVPTIKIGLDSAGCTPVRYKYNLHCIQNHCKRFSFGCSCTEIINGHWRESNLSGISASTLQSRPRYWTICMKNSSPSLLGWLTTIKGRLYHFPSPDFHISTVTDISFEHQFTPADLYLPPVSSRHVTKRHNKLGWDISTQSILSPGQPQGRRDTILHSVTLNVVAWVSEMTVCYNVIRFKPTRGIAHTGQRLRWYGVKLQHSSFVYTWHDKCQETSLNFYPCTFSSPSTGSGRHVRGDHRRLCVVHI